MVNLDCYNAQECMKLENNYLEMDCDSCEMFVHYEDVKTEEDDE